MKHYTERKAKREIGKSISWRDAKRVSIKKWKEIAKYRERYYTMGDHCGYCFVVDNRTIKGLFLMRESCGKHCPAGRICHSIMHISPQEVIKRIRKLKR